MKKNKTAKETTNEEIQKEIDYWNEYDYYEDWEEEKDESCEGEWFVAD